MSFVGKSSQGTSGFSPMSIPDCALWLDAADVRTVTLSGSTVTALADKSGNGRNGSGSGSVTYSSNAINNLGALSFPGNVNNTWIRGSLTNTGTTVTCFAVATLTTAATDNSRILSLGTIGSADFNSAASVAAIVRQSGTNLYSYRNGGGTSLVSVSYNTPFLTGCLYDGVDKILYVNGTGTSRPSASTGSFNISSYQIGTSFTEETSFRWGGLIAEVIIYNSALTNVQRQAVEGYLGRKWGVTSNLPVTQPFRPLPPFMRPFIPVDISGCALWLDAADGTSVNVSGSNVTSVLDKSGSNVVLSNSSGFTWPNNTFNGTYPSFFVANGGQGVGGTQRLGVNGELAIPTPFTVAFTAQQVGGNYGYILDSASGASRPFIYSPTINTAGASGGSNMTNASVAIVTFAPLSGSAVYQNGTTAASGVSVTLTTGGITIGNRFNLVESWPGHICEFIIYRGVLTTGQRQQVETYMANKWGLRGAIAAGHYARLAPALSTAFLPTQIGPCSVWLDAADLTTLTLSGSNVTAWRDKSGTVANATFTGTSVYSSANQYVQTPGGTGYFTVPCDIRKTTTPQCSIFTVHRWISNVAGTNQAVWGQDVGGGWNRIQLLAFPSGTQYAYGLTMGGTDPYTAAVNGLNTLNTVIYSAIYDLNVTNGSTAHVDGTQNAIFTETPASAQTSTQLTFFGSGHESHFYTPIGFNEVIMFRFKLTARERQLVEGYLANKWGLTSKLPAGHPFKRFKP